MVYEPADPLTAAANLLRRHRIGAPPVPVDTIAKLCRAAIRYIHIEKELLGTFSLIGEIPTIGVNSILNMNRQRFAIAHGLGHLELHRNLLSMRGIDELRCPTPDWQTEYIRIEVEANQFAAALLMPGVLMNYEALNTIF
jgi:Zn-dependent peptidase ImmA (M78 family)